MHEGKGQRKRKRNGINGTFDDGQEDSRKEVLRGVDELFASAREYASSARFRELMDFTGRFKQYAPYNAMLIYLQRPGARFVLSAGHWMRDYHRVVMTDRRPILILSPNGPLRCLFDVADTQVLPGAKDTFPPELLHPFEGDSGREVPPEWLADLKTCLSCLGICHGTMRTGESFAGKIEIGGSGDPAVKVPLDGERVLPWRPAYSIRVAEGSSATVQFASIVHDLGHLFCRHLPDAYGGKTRWRRISPDAAEFEAESVSWLVGKRLGVAPPSDRYLSEYLQDGREIPWETSVEEILKATTLVEHMLADRGEALAWFRQRCPAFREAWEKKSRERRKTHAPQGDSGTREKTGTLFDPPG